MLLFPLMGYSQSCHFEADQYAFINDQAQAVIVLGHGLNTNTKVMFPLGEKLCERGASVFMNRLKGHYGKNSLRDLKTVKAEEWVHDLKIAVDRAKVWSDAKQVSRLYFIGFSLSSLLGEVEQQRSAVFSKLVHLAPPFETKDLSRLSTLFLLPDSLVIPSANLKAYRANTGVPINAYRQLFKLQDEFNAKAFQDETPRLVFLEKDDELVSFNKSVKRLLSVPHLTIKKIDKSSDAKQFPHHLVVDQYTLGASTFQSLIQEISQFLEL